MAKSRSMKDFRIVQQLGKGSYGSVYKCERKVDKQVYAVKEVNIRKLSPREREDAVNEIRILASISHTNICRYCDAFTERDNLYIVMEFAEHGDVGRQISKFKKANKYIKEDTIWSYLIQMSLALQELHSRKILHRDIKPKNVFLTGKNHVRIGDLGCAKLMKTGMARTQIGTPYYMSPEIWCNRPYDQKSDVWALGAMIYELCMLNPPFIANDMNGLARKVKTAPTPRISKHYSVELADIIRSTLNKSPAARPSIDKILALPAVKARMHLLPEDDKGRWAEERESNLLATIKVPRYMGYGGVKLNLPGASYPDEEGAKGEKPSVPAAPKSRRSSSSSAAPSSSRPSSKQGAAPIPSARAKVAAAKGGIAMKRVPSSRAVPSSRVPSSHGARRPSSVADRKVSAAAAVGRAPSSRGLYAARPNLPAAQAKPSARGVAARPVAGGRPVSHRGVRPSAYGGRRAVPVSRQPSARPW